MNPYVSDATAKDLSSHLGVVASRGEGGLHAHFFYQRVEQTRGPEKFRTQLCVAVTPIGDRYTIATKYISEDEARRQFPAQYTAFCRSEELPSTGTPLNELPGITASQIGQLLVNGMRCIEDLCSINGDHAMRIGRDVAVAHKLATAWIARRDGAADDISKAEREAAAQRRERELQDRLDRLERQNIELMAQNSALSKVGGRQAASVVAASEPQGVDGENLPDPFSMPGLGEDSDYAEVSGNGDLMSDPLA